MKLIILADIHYGNLSAISERRSDIADILLLRAVHRINRYLKPDAVAVLGDIINDSKSPHASEQYETLKKILDILECPYIVIPGNHDTDPERFYQIFDKPDDIIELNNVRLVPFIDFEQPGYNAVREKHNLKRMEALRNNFNGDIITLQHVPIFPPGTTDCPYNYTNANEIIDLMKQYKIDLAISGHFHRGFDLIRAEHNSFITCPALCETPFSFLEITTNDNSDDNTQSDDKFKITHHQLAMPENSNLTDYHVHTYLAYCNENMNVEKAKSLSQAFNLAEIKFSEHSAHLYWTLQDYHKGIFCREGIQAAKPEDCRIEEYFSLLKNSDCPQSCIGFEVDCDWAGTPVIKLQDAQRASFLIGAIHRLPTDNINEIKEMFIPLLRKFLQADIKIQILAHPFRIFRRTNNPVPEKLFAPTVKLLKENNIAAEINFHTNEPPIEFIKMCIDANVKLSFGSDAHNLYEIGEFYPHLKLLNECNISISDLKDVLI